MAKAILVAQFLRARAWWRLDSAGANPSRVARSVVCLIDAASYLRDIPDDAPDIVALDAAGCFCGDAFDPGPDGAIIVREWQLADEITAGPADLLAELARAARAARAARQAAWAAQQAAQAGAPVSVPRQASAPGPGPVRTRAPSHRGWRAAR